MNLFCTPRLIVLVLSVFLLAGCSGGGGDGGSGEPPVQSRYDLTGRWDVAEPVDCVILSADLYPLYVNFGKC